jgi:hypothetical protein
VTPEQAARIARMRRPVIAAHPDDAARLRAAGCPIEVRDSRFMALGKALAFDEAALDAKPEPFPSTSTPEKQARAESPEGPGEGR